MKQSYQAEHAPAILVLCFNRQSMAVSYIGMARVRRFEKQINVKKCTFEDRRKEFKTIYRAFLAWVAVSHPI